MRVVGEKSKFFFIIVFNWGVIVRVDYYGFGKRGLFYESWLFSHLARVKKAAGPGGIPRATLFRLARKCGWILGVCYCARWACWSCENS